MRFHIDQSDVQAFARDFERNMNRGAARVVSRLADVAKRFLWRHYDDNGWRDLARKWDNTGISITPSEVSIEVYNKAEGERLLGRTTRSDVGRIRTTRYWITGERLLKILEYGAKSHKIVARNSDFLAFPSAGSNLDARTFRHVKKHGPGSFLKPQSGDIRFVQSVEHPGVSGAFILRRAEAAADEALDTIIDTELV